MSGESVIGWTNDDGVVTLTIDDPAHGANTLNAAFLSALESTLARIEAESSSIRGIIIASGKPTFFAGGNLEDILGYGPDDTAKIAATADGLKAQLRRLETGGVPVVAALGGAALGGGLELALAAHHRIAVDRPNVVVGFPEVSLGLLPGGGGIVRSVRMLGVAKALQGALLTGVRLAPAAALELGLVDEIVAGPDDLLPAARAWIAGGPDPVQPWDRPGYRLPGGAITDRFLAGALPVIPAQLRVQTRGVDLPAPRAIVAAAVEGASLDFDSASIIETRYFVSLVLSSVAKNLIKSSFFDLRAVNEGASRPSGFEKRIVRKLGVLGAGLMGAGVAFVAAQAGIEVVLKDVDLERAQAGKATCEKLAGKLVQRGRLSPAKSAELLARIVPAADPRDLAAVDFVVEAVFESVELKQRVFREIENIVGPDVVLGSNTSSLPITTLAGGVQRQDAFVGIHFFSPVDRMPLVELIAGEKTSLETLARAFDFARQIKKTPIVVNDSLGFFTSRVIIQAVNEAVAAVGEGVDPLVVERAATQAGYPAPQLQLTDELSLTLAREVRLEAQRLAAGSGASWSDHGSSVVIDRLIDEFGRGGRRDGRGFYDYDESGARVALWPGLRSAFGSGSSAPPLKDLQERMLFAEALESVRCLDEGVLTSPLDGNVGSILGIGYPAWTGGVFGYIDSYPGGLQGFVDRARELAADYGDHFQPPASLVARATANELYG